MVEAASSEVATKAQTVPVVQQLKDVYQDIDGSLKKDHEARFINLQRRFHELYGVKPAFFSKAPGRVNIIGEHIDYCGYSVLPAAIEQDMIMAYIPTDDDQITINNIDKDLYPQEVITTEPTQKFKEDAHWINYFLCGYKAILALESPLKGQVSKPKGMKILIDSNVPAAAGLSSSSAFCVCAAVTTLHNNGLIDQMDQTTLANLVIAAERMAGTACGGMDQTISIMGQFNTAKQIDFVPELKATDISVPDSVSLVIANSLTPSAKLLTLGTRYNKRVVECRFAVALLAIKTGLCTSFDDCTFLTLQELQVALGKTLEEMSDLAKEHLKKGGYTKQMLERDGNTEDPFAMVGKVPHIVDVMTRNAAFYPHERAVHVYNEAKRVYDFAAICQDTSLEEEDKVTKLGELMNKSHMSCNVLYDCSSEQLNELTALARSAGALGSRLTGAGWGGCCVSLVRKSELSKFVEKVMDFYTKEREEHDQLWITDDLKRYIFGTQLGRGALVLDPQFCVWAA